MNNFSTFSMCFAVLFSGSFSQAQKLSAQLNNKAFEESFNFPTKNRITKLFLQASEILNFLKNNEYFNEITSGQNFFWYFELSPALVYYPDPKVRLEAGGFLWRDFGDDEFTRVAPVFRLTYKKDCTSVTFGNVVGNLNHQLIEPTL